MIDITVFDVMKAVLLAILVVFYAELTRMQWVAHRPDVKYPALKSWAVNFFLLATYTLLIRSMP